MSQRVLGFVLVAVAIVGLIAAFGTLDETGMRGFRAYGAVWSLNNAQTFGSMPLGLVTAALAAVGLIGIGLLVFGKPSK